MTMITNRPATRTTAARKRKAAALAAAEVALARQQDAAPMLDSILAEGQASIAQLETILPLLEGHAKGLLEDAIGCMLHVQQGGKGDWFSIVRHAREAIARLPC